MAGLNRKNFLPLIFEEDSGLSSSATEQRLLATEIKNTAVDVVRRMPGRRDADGGQPAASTLGSTDAISSDRANRVPFIAAGQGAGSAGSGGQPGGGGGGGKGGRPGEESIGNNLSFPAIFPIVAGGAPPSLRGTPSTFTFTTAYNSSPVGPFHFAQGIADNEWQANSTTADAVLVNWVDIGDALETAPLRLNSNIRLELTLYDAVADVTGTPDDTFTGFHMTLLEGAKGKGKPSKTGPTELQGARLDPSYLSSAAVGLPFTGFTDDEAYRGTSFPTTYETPWASIYAAAAGGGETEADPYMNLAIQKVADGITGLDDETWNGSVWEGDAITSGNLFDGSFGPELNIAGKYIMGASGSPWQFTQAGTYLLTFSLENGAPIAFSDQTGVGNYDALTQTFADATGRQAFVVGNPPVMGIPGAPGMGVDNHNGLLCMFVTVPSTVAEAG